MPVVTARGIRLLDMSPRGAVTTALLTLDQPSVEPDERIGVVRRQQLSFRDDDHPATLRGRGRSAVPRQRGASRQS